MNPFQECKPARMETAGTTDQDMTPEPARVRPAPLAARRGLLRRERLSRPGHAQEQGKRQARGARRPGRAGTCGKEAHDLTSHECWRKKRGGRAGSGSAVRTLAGLP